MIWYDVNITLQWHNYMGNRQGWGSYWCTKGNRWWGVTSGFSQAVPSCSRRGRWRSFGVHFLVTGYDLMSTWVAVAQFQWEQIRMGGDGLLGRGLTGVLRETDGEGCLLGPLLKQVRLVQEEDDGGLLGYPKSTTSLSTLGYKCDAWGQIWTTPPPYR